MVAVSICSDFGAQENKLCHYFHCFPIYLPWSDGTRCQDLRFLNVELKPAFSLSSFTLLKRLFSSSSLPAYLRWLSLPAILIKFVTHPALLGTTTNATLSFITTQCQQIWLYCMSNKEMAPTQCSCLENPRDGGAWWAAIYGVAQSWTQLKRLSSSSSSSSMWANKPKFSSATAPVTWQ